MNRGGWENREQKGKKGNWYFGDGKGGKGDWVARPDSGKGGQADGQIARMLPGGVP